MRFSSALVLGLLVSLASAQADDHFFEDFTARFNRVYTTEAEAQFRRKVFDENMVLATKLQMMNPSATYGHLSPFADKTSAELDDLFVPLQLGQHDDLFVDNKTLGFGGPPSSYDSKEQGYVTEIKDQAEPDSGCNSCWAFVVATLLETGVARQQEGKLVNLSPQQLLDCDYRDDACKGGNMDKAFRWMEEMSYGLETLADYPYTAEKGAKCLATRSKMIVYPSKHYRLQPSDMTGACYEFGALGVGVNANPIALNTGGLIDLSAQECSPKVQTHAVTIVGYGTQAGVPFWHFKNTWGTIWGNKGYGMIRRGRNTCGIETFVIGAVVRAPRSQIVV